MFPSFVKFKFETSSLTALALIGAAIVIVFNISLLIVSGQHLIVNMMSNLFECVGLVALLLSPQLTAGFHMSQSNSATRMEHGVYKTQCLALPRITMAGQLNIQCWDKTGTLTTDGLDFFGVLGRERSWVIQYRTGFRPVSDQFQTGFMPDMRSPCHSVNSLTEIQDSSIRKWSPLSVGKWLVHVFTFVRFLLRCTGAGNLQNNIGYGGSGWCPEP